ncbi:hypothetical protein NDU88_000354 [Pleurodeles waltl]|uniref:Uncharacterized protein n=1 Tax=Pleurodeles waltl TaxID=8319 RepID=A0AAV7V5G4_PLEWA|nr:hypothetical protein NDU88_000354 [Pleurodeles waltl]
MTAHEEASFAQEQENLFLAEDIVHALDASATQSVNRALAAALQLIARQLKRYSLTVPPYGHPNTMPITSRKEERSPQGPEWPHAAPMARLSQSSTADHQYSARRSTSTQALSFPPLMTPVTNRILLGLTQTMTHSLKNVVAILPTNCPPSDNVDPTSALTFDPDPIIHPFSSEWTPLPAVTEYVHSRLRKALDKEV